MTTAAPDGVLTAGDLLFGSQEKAHEALRRHVMADGRAFARSLVHLPRVTREAAVREAAVAAAGLLKVDLIEVLVSGWREHRDIFSAARRTLEMPGSTELVGLAPHRISTVQQPAVGILIDGKRVHTLQLGLSIFFEVTGLVAGISHGRLAAVHAGRGHVGVALTIHEIEVLTKRSHLELPGHAGLKRGFRLLSARHYPDEPREHPSGAHPDAQLPAAAELMSARHPGTELSASQFPSVNLADGHSPAAELPGAQNPAAPVSPPTGLDHAAPRPPPSTAPRPGGRRPEAGPRSVGRPGRPALAPLTEPPGPARRFRQADIGRIRRACFPGSCQGPRVQDQVPWASSRP